ncbi:alpha/beta fold hydrolase (plasmid) [Streptomyces sp. HUAS TT11]|uniref:alpha/beta fold hydrolase n=1 Tax=Streptomyces sp. HUAS TT11 TaxID=3447508 RepID=UPI003F65A7BC
MDDIAEAPRGARHARAAAGEARTVVVDGVRQVYRLAGKGPVCLVHPGGPGAHPAYLRIPELEEKLTLVYLDPVGSGDSALLPDGNYSMSRYGRFAEAVLDDIGTSTAFFLGHSHGGFVALQFALDHPDRLDGLILYDTAPAHGRNEREAATQEMAFFVQRWADRPEAVEAGRIWDAVNLSRTMEIIDTESFGRYMNGILPAYFADYRRTVKRTGQVAIAVTYDPNRIPVVWDVRGRLSSINVPALVIVGTYDFVCPPRFAHEIHASIPDTRLCELRESGHFGHIEQPNEFASAVIDFVYAHKTENGE